MKMGPLVLVILDGWGVAPEGKGNAISVAKTPVFDFLKRNYPYTELGAAGKSIGLSKGHQGSSEMGHLIIGAGRSDILPQHRVYNAVKSGEVFENKAYLGALEHAAKNNSTLHLMGLLSDKGVHNYDILEHALIEMAAKNGVKELIVHVFTDGRDTAPFDSKKYVEKLLGVMKENNLGKIGTVMGRYWIMDRDHRWERVEKGYNAIVHGKAEFYEKSAFDAIKNSYTRNKSDEFIMPTVIVDENNESIGKVKNNDAIIWCNFRVDRSIEATRAFIDDDFKAFYRGGKLNVYFVGSFQYYPEMKVPVAFERIVPENTLGEIISKEGMLQLRVSETEKWVYLTTIFNGMREKPFKGEERILIPSDKIPTYDLMPKMKAFEIAGTVVNSLKERKFDFVVVNFANPDILGHTGIMKAVVEGVEAVDFGLGAIIDAVREVEGVAVITADHGDAEVMLKSDGNAHTHHTANDVPFIIFSGDGRVRKLKLRKGKIEDIAPTVLELLELGKSEEMRGKSLILH